MLKTSTCSEYPSMLKLKVSFLRKELSFCSVLFCSVLFCSVLPLHATPRHVLLCMMTWYLILYYALLYSSSISCVIQWWTMCLIHVGDCYAMLCYAMLCYAMLCYAKLCFMVAPRDELYFTVLYNTFLYCLLLSSFVLSSIHSSFLPFWVISYISRRRARDLLRDRPLQLLAANSSAHTRLQRTYTEWSEAHRRHR